MLYKDGYQITRHTCPRNCYDSCPLLAYTRNGRIEKLTGDASSNPHYAQLCAKGKQILDSVYHPQRLLFPLRQQGRGTGHWQRITWDTAIEIIARKMLALKERYHSTLPLCLNKYSGNFGLLHYACEGMFNSLGPTTQTTGTPCFSSGIDAQKLDFGGNITSDVQTLVHSQLIILWGVNPAWTSIHSMEAIYQAQAKGTKIVVIDPLYTETARKADYYIQIRPGSDAALVLLLLQKLAARGALHNDPQRIRGGDKLLADIQRLDQSQLEAVIDQPAEAIDTLIELIASQHPMHIWCGFGMQRHVHGGLTIRLIDALAMLTGNIGIPGGGVNFADREGVDFPYATKRERADTRYVNINQFSQTLRSLQDPPVRLLWIACRNLVSQDVGLRELQALWSELELVVVADKFLTKTAEMADIVLPVTTEFEDIDVYTGYFPRWLGINEAAIPPRGEAKSDLEIARLLTRRLNELAPGTSDFPAEQTDEEFLDAEFPPAVCRQLGINGWRQLREGAIKVRPSGIAWQDGKFATDDGKFHCCELPKQLDVLLPTEDYPFHFITPHAQQSINGQTYTRLAELPEYPVVYIHPDSAKKRRLTEGQHVILWNEYGSLTATIAYDDTLAADILMSYQGSSQQGNVNALNGGHPTDLGTLSTGAPGLALYDVFVNIRAK
ncbi:Anaerobic selenocysteine-containing dehydrogenase [Selenomonas sp. GACV-9]|uniref:molybdopterin-dependent oxidoreductase n=1 Tax=Selenomonas sp. GACV-9 TaxID=3158782 RepID=UPI0008E2C8E9|nr:Anaerobic selenocysteine-containing dehydrogenase [Selenomonas ruminantium]